MSIFFATSFKKNGKSMKELDPKVSQGIPRGPNGSQGVPRGPKGSQGILRDPSNIFFANIDERREMSMKEWDLQGPQGVPRGPKGSQGVSRGSMGSQRVPRYLICYFIANQAILGVPKSSEGS